jgi:hypothetical protein
MGDELDSWSSESTDPDELALLATFRNRIEGRFSAEQILTLAVPPGAEFVDTGLLRFLRARKGNEDKAFEMVEEVMSWREGNGVDGILSRPLPEWLLDHLRRYYDEGVSPIPDRFGRPIYVITGGKTSELSMEDLFKAPAGLPDNGQAWTMADLQEAFLHHHLQIFEYVQKVRFTQLTAEKQALVNKMVFVDDIGGMGMKGNKNCFKFSDALKAQTKLDSLLYPEMLGQLFFINAPKLFEKVWELLSSWIDDRTRNKIQILAGPSVDNMKENVPDEALPEIMGGTLQGNIVSNRDNPVTPFYEEMDAYIAAQAALASAQRSPDWDNLQTLRTNTISIPAKSQKEHCMEVIPDCTVCWEFMVEAKDVDFSAHFQHSDGSQDELTALTRVECDGKGGKVRGRYVHGGSTPGNLILTWNNSYSSMTSKSIRYRCAVIQ